MNSVGFVINVITTFGSLQNVAQNFLLIKGRKTIYMNPKTHN